MKKQQLGLFDDQRATSQSAIQETIDSLWTYGNHYKNWAIAYSGGKDSTTLVTLVLYLLETEQIPKPESLTVLYADTRLELPPLHSGAMAILEKVRERGYTTQVVRAELDKRFLVYLLGRGVPAPNNSTLRWCTNQIKLEPMKQALQQLSKENERFLMLTGVRVGESASRDQRISTSCSKNGAECGQGWFQNDLNGISDTLAPLLHWRVCHIWDWLMLDAPQLGFDTELLCDVYGGDDATEINARTGCIGCPLTDKDMALENLVKDPKYTYFKPLLGMKPIFRETRRLDKRLKKVIEYKKDGSIGMNPGRCGPVILEFRLELLERILVIQSEINTAAKQLGKLPVDILNQEEEARIRELIALGTYPNKWHGDEVMGDSIVERWYEDGSVQYPLFSEI
jgi:DNA sulfur modification protein DndC